jgi:hypothetical protein
LQEVKNMRIEVPLLPGEELSPNARAHWSDRHQAAVVFFNAVYYSCVDAINRSGQVRRPYPKARLNLTFVFSQERKRDRDNLISMFKPGLDAIVQAGLLEDDDSRHLEIGEVKVEVDKERAPLTIIELQEEAEQ